MDEIKQEEQLLWGARGYERGYRAGYREGLTMGLPAEPEDYTLPVEVLRPPSRALSCL